MDLFKDKSTFKKHFKHRLERHRATAFDAASQKDAYKTLAEMTFEAMSGLWVENEQAQQENPRKELHYFSMEFLLGRLITSNLYNLGIRDTVKEAFDELGLDLEAIEHQEVDAGLGNGGLGRLAACFLDSIASLGYRGHGNGIRYSYGFFEQYFKDGYQREKPDDWLKDGYPWEIRREQAAVDIPFGGSVDFDGETAHHDPEEIIRAVPYDVPIPGETNGIVNTLRLWNAEATDVYPQDVHPFEYNEEIRQISGFLYPDDTTEEGKILRIKQQYFFSAAGVRRILADHLSAHGTLADLPEKHVFQINDTHPALIIPETMRALIDDYGYEWEDAWRLTQKTCAYTNHIILAEALERWPVSLLQPTLPRVFQIIEEINRRYTEWLGEAGYDHGKIRELAIVDDGEVRMAHLAIVGSFSVNGVAKLHTDILKRFEMKDFYTLFPEKFNAKTNGVTHRRFFKHMNPELHELMRGIDPDYDKTPLSFEALEDYIDDAATQERFLKIKQEHKNRLAKRIEREQGVKIDPESIFDVQIKRMHEYKRQLMNALHILIVYNRLKNDVHFRRNYVPHTFIFGAKAAASYHYAKKVIKLINTIGQHINNDPQTKDYLKVVFVENYNVTYAEQIIPAADVSEQISTATKEASGTGNMKFMMNGSLTLGTLDGANVEIAELAGEDNIVIFGMDSEEVTALKESGEYDPRAVYESDGEIRTAVDMLTNGFFSKVPRDEFTELRDNLLGEDGFFVLKDLPSYREAHERVNDLYRDRRRFASICLANIARSAYFTSDRTIEDYVRDIWKLPKKS